MGMTAEERADKLCNEISAAGGYEEMDIGVAEKWIAAAIKSAERDAHNAAIEAAARAMENVAGSLMAAPPGKIIL